MTDPTESSIIEFDEEFPSNKWDETERIKEIFAVLQACSHTPGAFEHSSDISKRKKINPMNENMTTYGGPMFGHSINYHTTTRTYYQQ